MRWPGAESVASQPMRRAAILVLATAAAAAGCGGDGADPEKTVSLALRGAGEGKAKQVCDQLSDGAERKLLAVLKDPPLGLPAIKADTCEPAITELHAALKPVYRDVLIDHSLAPAKIDGDRAVVHADGLGMDVELQKVDGRWIITGGLLGKEVAGG